MSVNPYLFFNGTCEEAFKFYAELMGGRIETMMRYAEAPAEERGSPEQAGKIMHAYLKVGDQALMASDAPPERYGETKGFYVQLSVGDPEEAERVYNALADEGTVHMSLQETFWARRFGMVVDRFGVPWMVNCNKP